MYRYASELIDLLLVLVAAWMVAAIIFVVYAYFAGLKYPVSRIGLWTCGRHFLLHHNHFDLAPDDCGRHSAIADRSFVFSLQDKPRVDSAN